MIPSRSNRIPLAVALTLSGLFVTSTLANAATPTTIKSAITKKGAAAGTPAAPKAATKVAKTASAKTSTKSTKTKATTPTTVVKKKSTPTSAPADTKVPDTKAPTATTATTPAEPTTTKKAATTASTTATSAPAPLTKAGMVFIPGAGRVLDLDANQVAKLAAGGSVAPDVRGANGLAASGTGSVIVDVIVSNPTVAGKVTLSPASPDYARTVVASNLSFPASATTVTRLAVPVGAGGKVKVTTTTGPSGIAMEVVGWVVAAPAGTNEAAALPLEACRLLDTSNGTGGLSGEVTQARPFDIPAVGVFKVPPALGGTQVPTGVILSVGASAASGPLEVTVVPTGSQSPALVMSMSPGQVSNGIVVVPVGTDARAAFYVSQNGVQLTADVLGWIDRDKSAKTAGPCA
jgi:hypothetical protein